MKKIKNFKQYNESITGDIGRLIIPNRRDNDSYLLQIFEDMKKDFLEYNSDLKKVKLVGSNSELDITRIKFGESLTMEYLFGEYDKYENNLDSAVPLTRPHKHIRIAGIPAELVLIKNSLEKTFNTSRFSFNKSSLTITEHVANSNYNPNIVDNLKKFKQVSSSADREMMNPYVLDLRRYNVSFDYVFKVIKFFKDAFISKYPELKDSEYYNSRQISDIENNIPPVLKYIEGRSIDGENWMYELRDGENEKEITKLYNSMTIDQINLDKKTRKKNIQDKQDQVYASRQNIIKDREQSLMNYLKEISALAISNDYIAVNAYGKNYVYSTTISNQNLDKIIPIIQKLKDNFNIKDFIWKEDIIDDHWTKSDRKNLKIIFKYTKSE